MMRHQHGPSFGRYLLDKCERVARLAFARAFDYRKHVVVWSQNNRGRQALTIDTKAAEHGAVTVE
jgi:hypothetical protein